jgi:hypothetical protein
MARRSLSGGNTLGLPRRRALHVDRQRRNGITDASESPGIVARRSGPQAHLLAVLTGNDAIAVELNLVQPARAGRRPMG